MTALGDRPDQRRWFQGRFREELQASGRPFVEVSGSVEERLAQASDAIDRLLAGTVDVPTP